MPTTTKKDAKKAGKKLAAKSSSKAQKRAAASSAPDAPSAGRQSVLKAGMSRFSKSKDKKAA